MQKKIIVSTLLSVIVILLGLGIISNLSINDSIGHSLTERTDLAAILASYTDYRLQNNLTRLYDISLSGSIDLNDDDWDPEDNALKTAYQYSIFTDGIFLLDLKGNVVRSYPLGQQKRNLMGNPYVRRTIEENRAVISNIYTEEGTNKRVIYVLVPLTDKNGWKIGAVGGEINPTNYVMTNLIRSIPTRGDTIIELVDSFGVVIASNNPVRVFACSDRNKILGNLINSKQKSVMKCHRCHEGEGGATGTERGKTIDMLAFAPLSEAPWGISVRESEKMVFAPSSQLRKKFLILGLISIGSALVFSLGISRSIVTPIRSLTMATKKIAGGILKEPVRVVSRDEIGALGMSFETMRVKLSESLDKIQKYNTELEERVFERTMELQQSRKRLSILLHEVIRAQEEERKRIARELHDETSQSIAALGMSIEIAAIALKENALTPETIYELRAKVTQLLEGISRLIHDLRPPVLDDLGLESGVRWLLERHLSVKGIKYQLNASEEFQKLISSEETILDDKTVFRLFRIIQEAIINVSKHAQASNVAVSLLFDGQGVKVHIKDNGIGFDVQTVFEEADSGTVSGFGLIGLKERAALLEGTVDIRSIPGEGTEITIIIPLSSLEVQDV
ncbi:MAG TPA: cache domain-containing protein [Candidatus Sulfobium mesophilum]|nr:cache domain-containing protein [Candidatus Sulfobium mesophilum]